MNDWKKEAKERYKALKEKGESFFPGAVFKDTLVSLIIFIALLALAIKFGAELQSPADPTDITYNPRPEWYFLFLFQALKFFPGTLEPIAAVFLPGFGLILLILIPFIDRSRYRHPFDRPVFTSVAVLTLGGILFLTVTGARAPLTNKSVEKDPEVLAGKMLYETLRCNYCHMIDGQGGKVGPDLSLVGSSRDDEWIVKHFRSPRSVTAGSRMPDLNLMDDEMVDLVAYMRTLGGGGGPFTPQAKILFQDYCMACHKLNGQGEEVGPDLSIIGTYRDKSYITKYIQDPSVLNPEATMPGYTEMLKPDQIEDLARLLTAQRGKK